MENCHPCLQFAVSLSRILRAKKHGSIDFERSKIRRKRLAGGLIVDYSIAACVFGRYKLADLIVRGWNFPFPLEGLGGITGRRNFCPKLVGL